MYGLYFIFGDQYIQSRAVMISMTMSAPLMCFGFDTSAPLIIKQEKNSAFLWNFLLLQTSLMVIFFIAALGVEHQKTSFILLGLSLGAVFSSKIFIVEYQRGLGQIKQYFFDLHVRDRFYRTAAILLVAMIFSSITTWAITLLLLSLIYLAIMTSRYWVNLYFDPKSLRRHLFISTPYLCISLVIVAFYRLPFYISYFQDSSFYATKIDFWSMMALFILLPYSNALKFAETAAKDQISVYVKQLKSSWYKTSLQQTGIVILIACITVIGMFIETTEKQDIIEIIVPLTLSITLISLMPSFCYMAMLSGRTKLSIISAALFLLLSLICYIPKYLNPDIPVSYLMLINAGFYIILNFWCSIYFLSIRSYSILRLRQGLFVGSIIFILFGLIYLAA